MAEESKTTVLAAMAANVAIAAGKLVAGILSGSAALLAEAGHSFADTVDQVFLLVGINLADTRPDERHPHGYGKESFFWSFLAAIFIFVAGAVFSWYEGIRTLVEVHAHHRSAGELILSFGVLGMAAVFESASLSVAIRHIRRSAREASAGFWRYVRNSPDLTTKTVLWEDSAALTGLALAALGLGLSELFDSEVWDGLASVCIGVVLAGVALMLGNQARQLLLGAAAPPGIQEAIRDTIHSFPEVDAIVRLLTMQLGSRSVLVTGELQVGREMTTGQIEELIGRIDRRLEERVPDVSETFWELRRCPE